MEKTNYRTTTITQDVFITPSPIMLLGLILDVVRKALQLPDISCEVIGQPPVLCVHAILLHLPPLRVFSSSNNNNFTSLTFVGESRSCASLCSLAGACVVVRSCRAGGLRTRTFLLELDVSRAMLTIVVVLVGALAENCRFRVDATTLGLFLVKVLVVDDVRRPANSSAANGEKRKTKYNVFFKRS